MRRSSASISPPSRTAVSKRVTDSRMRCAPARENSRDSSAAASGECDGDEPPVALLAVRSLAASAAAALRVEAGVASGTSSTASKPSPCRTVSSGASAPPRLRLDASEASSTAPLPERRAALRVASSTSSKADSPPRRNATIDLRILAVCALIVRRVATAPRANAGNRRNTVKRPRTIKIKSRTRPMTRVKCRAASVMRPS